MALLFRDFDKRVEIRSTREGLIRFHRMSEAVLYLRNNGNRPGVIGVLRQVLSEHHHVQVSRLSDDAVIDEVARRLLNGSLQLMEMFEPRAEVSAAIKGLIEEKAEEPIEVEPAPPPPASKAPEPVVEPELTAGVEAELPPEIQIEAEIEKPPALAAEAEVEPQPAVELGARVGETPAPAVKVGVTEPPVLAAEAEVTEQPAVKLEAKVEERAAPEVRAQAKAPPAPEVKAQAKVPPALAVGMEVRAEKPAAPEGGAPDGRAPAEEPTALATKSSVPGGSKTVAIPPVPLQRWIEFELRDENGDLVPDEPFKVLAREEDEVLAEGMLDAKAHARVALGAGQCRIVYPKRDNQTWVFGVLGAVAKRTEVLAPIEAARRWIEIELRDAEGDPVAGENIRVVGLDGKVLKEATTNSYGGARIEDVDASECRIVYLERDRETWVFGVLGAVAAPSEVLAPLAGPARWIEIELRNADGEPVAGEKYQIVKRDGTVVAEGTLDATGRARPDVLTAECSIIFPGRDHRTWVFGVLGSIEPHKEVLEPLAMARRWIEIELRDENGDPVPGEKVKVLKRDGTVAAEATLDSNGCARVEIDAIECSVVYDGRDHRTWVFGSIQKLGG